MIATSCALPKRCQLIPTAILSVVQDSIWLVPECVIVCHCQNGMVFKLLANVSFLGVVTNIHLFINIYLEILCSPLPKITSFGVYEPTDCSEQKVSHGSNCSLICPPGFEIKGPSTKSCSGKRTGVWSNKNKTPKCVGI